MMNGQGDGNRPPRVPRPNAARKTPAASASQTLLQNAHRKRKRAGHLPPGVKAEQSFGGAQEGAGDVDWNQQSSSADANPEVIYSATYTCSLCGVQMTRYDSFQRHKKTMHRDVVYRCSVCGKVFNRKDSLTKHRRTHSQQELDEYAAE